MPYNSGIPTGPQRLKDSQRPMRENFQEIQKAFSTNHVAIGSEDAGKHTVVVFPVQSPEPTAAANQIVMYSAKYTNATDLTELYVRKNGALGIPFTARNSAVDAGGTRVYWTFLPSGTLLKYGEVDTVPTTGKTVDLKLVTQPSFSGTPFISLATLQGTAAPADFYASATDTTLTISHNHSGSTHTFSFLVMGVGDPTPT